MRTPLTDRLIRRIRAGGPLTIAQYMQAALQDPEHGYYRTGKPLGAEGDFVTSPEISQIFGELLGLWAAASWQQMGSPDPVNLIELGPGRGLLMADALRAVRGAPDFAAALSVHLVESHPGLRAEQKQRLTGRAELIWHDDFAAVPSGPFILIANEFVDALPIRQFICRAAAWHERLVDTDGDGLCFVEAAAPYAEALLGSIDGVEDGEIVEISPERSALIRSIVDKNTEDPFSALIIDYGYTVSRAGETLQALHQGRPAPPLSMPGAADLTAHVDFAALMEAAQHRAQIGGPDEQGGFLAGLGLEERTRQLIDAAGNEADRERIAAASLRLVDPAAMGKLFKVLGLTAKGLPPPIGLQPAALRI